MNIKYILSGLVIGVIISSLILILMNLSYKDEVIYVKTIKDYSEITSNIEKKINKVKNEECKNSLNNMLDRINETYFKENTTVEKYYKTYFKDDANFLMYFDEVNEVCKLDKGKTDQIYINALSSMNYPYKIKEKYESRYILYIKDNLNKDNYKTHDEVGTYTTKMLELKVINDLLGEIK